MRIIRIFDVMGFGDDYLDLVDRFEEALITRVIIDGYSFAYATNCLEVHPIFIRKKL